MSLYVLLTGLVQILSLGAGNIPPLVDLHAGILGVLAHVIKLLSSGTANLVVLSYGILASGSKTIFRIAGGSSCYLFLDFLVFHNSLCFFVVSEDGPLTKARKHDIPCRIITTNSPALQAFLFKMTNFTANLNI